MNSQQKQISKRERFSFGENWNHFSKKINHDTITDAENSLRMMLQLNDIKDKLFLDIGCGSGLFSLAARNLGAKVRSFDFDPVSVATTQKLKDLFYTDDPEWVIEEASVLDDSYISMMGKYDIVYSWGVLHHTGNMWKAIENAMKCVKPNGSIFIAIYNDQGLSSRYWRNIKKIYNRVPSLQWPLKIFYMPYFVGFGWFLKKWRERKTTRTVRGMTLWYDMVDWLGGYPFEYSTPEKINAYFYKKGFKLVQHTYVGKGLGCNEYVFKHVK